MLINKITSVVLTLETYKASLVPRPLSDFISQPWRKIGRRPGIKIRHEPEMVDSVSTNRKTEKKNNKKQEAWEVGQILKYKR